MDIERLKHFTPFDGMQDEYLLEALTNIKEETLTKGHMLFKRGKAIAARYFLIEGQVDLIDSQYQSSLLRGATPDAFSVLNPESPTRCSCVVKDPKVSVFSMDAEVLDRLTAWSESAEAAFEQEMSEKVELPFDPGATGQFDVVSVNEDVDSDWMSSLLTSPLFTRIPLTHVQELFAKFADRSVATGEVIIREGQKGDFFYVIAKGRARITNHLKSVDVELGPGQHFGEEALLGDTLRNATITMLEEGELKCLNNEDFTSLLTEPVLEYVDADNLDALEKPYKLIDVKMPLEYRAFHIKNSINLPLARLRTAVHELATHPTYIIAGDAGSRSKIAAHLLCQAGFDALILRDEPQLS